MQIPYILDIYLKNGIVNKRSLMGHSIHLNDDEISIFKQTQAYTCKCKQMQMQALASKCEQMQANAKQIVRFPKNFNGLP